MGLFNSVFGKGAETRQDRAQIPWISLTSTEQLEEIAKKSNTVPQVIFKHSTTCGISRMVLNMFTNSFNLGNEAEMYFLDLHGYREVSNAIESRFGVIHESPQLLIIKNGEVNFHTSHGAIADMDLKAYL
nr:bacillithiol system redox-active protein YtxJ [Allomuricauda sp.]